MSLMALRREILADNPWLYWETRETSGTTAADSSPNSRPGTYNVGPTLNQPSAVLSDPAARAVKLNGTSQYLSASLSPWTGSFTFELLLWRDDSSTTDILMSDSGNHVLWTMESGSNDSKFWADVSSTNALWSGGFPGTAQWMHTILRHDNPNAKSELIVNGVSKGQKTTSAFSAFGSGLAFGVRLSDLTNYLVGRMGEIAIYSGLLSDARVQAHWMAVSRHPRGVQPRRLRRA